MFKHKKAIGGEVIISFFSTILIIVALILFSWYSGVISKTKFRDVSSELLKSTTSQQVALFLESYLNTPISITIKNEEETLSLSELIILAAATDNPVYRSKLIDESNNLLAVFGKGTEAANPNPNCYYLEIEKVTESKTWVIAQAGNAELPPSAVPSAVLPLPTGGYASIRMIIDNQC